MAAKISEAEVRHISYLSRLNPSDAQVAQASEQLSAILEYMEQLAEVDTSQVPPTAHALPVHNVFREDVPVPGLNPDQALANAPQRDGVFFALPKVLEQDSA
ncbi:MAG TPA: Asp-tRNA(Asn)/Glu-tRNA(Gln) amidotransferase subunit GatC [Phycisphaerae bacterium]|nr:Asp-tRNA(Asn)/Glu-tRNA(Gln) amidotransferase subunit GatC [Phycisphaerae bacterium]HRY69359.1 Asp-tRNA(Asn)/Glu-tRNA(Gln) amidotransferase subunit GatC [Phycisphaerae bacterium]HSA26226.1 Asp-tRNA(Asn)/Glu-tRNA(Gln) amidotransferase subunit GatC [Phycisphaerae bacterium]